MFSSFLGLLSVNPSSPGHRDFLISSLWDQISYVLPHENGTVRHFCMSTDTSWKTHYRQHTDRSDQQILTHNYVETLVSKHIVWTGLNRFLAICLQGTLISLNQFFNIPSSSFTDTGYSPASPGTANVGVGGLIFIILFRYVTWKVFMHYWPQQPKTHYHIPSLVAQWSKTI